MPVRAVELCRLVDLDTNHSELRARPHLHGDSLGGRCGRVADIRGSQFIFGIPRLIGGNRINVYCAAGWI